MADEIPDFLSVPNVPGGRVAMAGLSPDMQQSLLTKYGTPSFGAGPAEPLPRVDGGAVYPSPSGPPTSPAVTTAIQDAQSAGFKLPDPTPALNGNPSSYDWSKLSGPDKTFLMTRMGYNNPPDAPTSIGAPAAAMAPQPTSPVVPNPPGGPSGGPMGAAVQASMGTSPAMQSTPGAGIPGMSVSPKDFEQLAKSRTEGLDAGIKAANERAGFLDQESRRIQEQQQQEQQRQLDRSKFYDDKQKEISNLTDQVTTPSPKVDPNHYWADKSTGQKTLAGIAVFLSGLGQGLMGKAGNPALEMIQKNIDTDIQLQKEANADAKESARAKLTGKMSLLNLARQRFSDEDASVAAARGMGREMAANQMESLVARAAGDQQKAALTGGAAQMRIEAGKYFDEAKARQFNMHIQQQQADAASMHGEAALMDAGAKAAAKGTGKDLPNEVLDRLSGYQSAKSIIRKLKDDFVKNTDFTAPVSGHFPGKTSQYENARNVGAEGITRAFMGSRATPEAMKMFLAQMPPAATTKAQGVAQYDRMLEDIEAKEAADKEMYGRTGHNVSGIPANSQELGFKPH